METKSSSNVNQKKKREAWLCISDIAKWCYATFELSKISQLQEII